MSKAPAKKQKPAPKAADNTKKTAAVETTKTDDALDSFLSRDNASDKGEKPPKKKKLSRGSIALIIAIAAVAALIITVVVIANRPVDPIEDEELPSVPAELATTVDEKGEHHVEVATDEEGEIKQNGYGELVSYEPKQITKIEVENTAGSFTVNASTPQGEATVYTVTGFEGYELQTGMADAVANDAARLSFTTIAAVGGNLSDFGLESPRALVKVTYNDNTAATIRVGNEADGGAGTYVTLGNTDDVFLVANDSVDSFLYSVLDLISREITPAAQSVEDSEYSVIELSGTRYPDPIALAPNTDDAFKNYSRMTAPHEMFVDNYESNDITGSIRDLSAESVVCVNPSSGQLSSFGVAEPYASVHAVYPDVEINLSCSGPTDDGLVNLYSPDKGIIYTIRLDKLGWANTDFEQLLPKTVIQLNKSAVSGMIVSAGGKRYEFSISTTVETVDDVEVTSTKATMNGKKLPEDGFNIFFQNFNGMKNLGMAEDSGTNAVYEARISYSNGRADDTVTVFDVGSNICPVVMNGTIIGSVSKSHVNGMKQDLSDLESGKIPVNL